MRDVELVDEFKLVGHELDGKFRVDQLVARGGFGWIYRATHRLLERPVALKVLRAPDNLSDAAIAAFHDAFLREAKTIVRLRHPHIVQVLDFGVSDMPSGVRAPWSALEWLDGDTLQNELVARRGRGGRAPAECLALLRPVIEALATAHADGVVHRDVKPGNVMWTHAREGPQLKLIDFGVAKLMDGDELAGTGATLTHGPPSAFSLRYAAPEQLGGARTGPWTDVHALGLLLTEVLTDKLPFVARDRSELFAEVFAPLRPTPAARGVDVGAWEDVIRRALALRPAERIPNAGALLAELVATLPDARAPKPSTTVHASDEPVTLDATLADTASALPEADGIVPSHDVTIAAAPHRRTIRWAATAAIVASLIAAVALGVGRTAPAHSSLPRVAPLEAPAPAPRVTAPPAVAIVPQASPVEPPPLPRVNAISRRTPRRASSAAPVTNTTGREHVSVE